MGELRYNIYKIFAIKRGGSDMEYKVGNVVQLKKTHPCGSDMWEIVRIGMDIKPESVKFTDFKC